MRMRLSVHAAGSLVCVRVLVRAMRVRPSVCVVRLRRRAPYL
jgi:hypothetical protein